MKNHSFLASLLLLAAACGPASQPESTTDSSAVMNETATPAELAYDEKAVNLFANTMSIFTGTMVLSFSQAFGQVAQGFAGLGGETARSKVDSAMAQIPKEISLKIDTIANGIGSGLRQMKDSLPEVYERLFSDSIMQRGIDIAQNPELPDGFRSLTEPLSSEDIMAYITYISATSKAGKTQDSSDVVMQTYGELFAWLQDVGKKFENDTEVQAVLKAKRGR
ncbi:MAG: hypothetical protein HC842_05935 [Cytophagales bacterium]|nr:hypothetical protein [Synechococcaceae cyanobacterium SM2_3_60]NJM94251.1 hypothetical protein [Cytophagales bacterium]